jgi:tetratricopeptide (TPR) repeat protein
LERAFAYRLVTQALWHEGAALDFAPRFEHVLAQFRRLGEPRYVELSLQDRGMHRRRCGDAAGARADLQEAISIAVEHGFERDLLALQINLAELELLFGNVAASIALTQEALERRYAMREPATFAVGWSNLAMYYGIEGRWPAASAAAETALGFAHEAGDAASGAFALQTIAAAMAATGEASVAGELLGYVDTQLAARNLERGATESAQLAFIADALQKALDPSTIARLRDAGSRLSPAEAERLAFPARLAGIA